MARAIWTGSISFGLVSIPVGLFSATEDHTFHFHQFERGTSDRIRNQRVNERTGRGVEYSDIVKGAEVGNGDHVLVEPDELADIAPGRSRSIDITTFVDVGEIDPVHFQKVYWLAPPDEQYARPYALLREAMARTSRAGIATFVMRGREYLTALRADGDVLALHTLFFADEIRDPSDLPNLPRKIRAKGKELDMAVGLIESMSGPWKPEEYRDTYTERVEQLVDDKRRGREIVTESEPPEPTRMADLISALERSVEQARSGHSVEEARRGHSVEEARSGRRGKGGGKGGGRKGRTPEPDLSHANKAELTEMARELGVRGRSTMTRDELERAVAREAS